MAESTDFHALSAQEVLSRLDTSMQGLTTAAVQRRLERYGPNEIEAKEKPSKLSLLWAQVKNPLIAILVAAAIISLLAREYIDVAVILAVIVFNTLLGFIQESRAEDALEALMSRAAPEAEVIRDCSEVRACVEQTVKAAEIVPGDILLLNAGDKIPADARILEAANLEIDESMLTGESLAVRKTADPLPAELPMAERTNIAYGGTIVMQGRGRAVVVATGSSTEIGKIAALIQETERVLSPLQRQTVDLGRKLALLAVVVSATTFSLGLIRGYEMQEMFLFAMASAVSSIPEGLPAVMTITLAVGVNRMARRNAIIRRLQAVDTLGAATAICTDKTGTLTTNEMTVQQILVGDRLLHVTGVGFEPHGEFRDDDARLDPEAEPALIEALRIGALASDARLARHETEGGHRWEMHGDATEGALVVAAAKAGLHKVNLEEEFPRYDEIPFDPRYKFMATFHSTPVDGDIVYLKGSPETVLELSARRLQGEQTAELTGEQRKRILRANEEMASRALRVLGVAYRSLNGQNRDQIMEGLLAGEASLTFAGLLGMMDPPRPEVKDAIETTRTAGIKVIMATGDHKLTGEAVARQVGLMEGQDMVLVGSDVEQMSDQELDEVIEDTAVFARVSPTHKHRIVESLRRKGHVVAMTGDGVNDAPALQAADVGVAMGITGTDVTKETADVVLTDDNFASIVNAVEEGRVVFQNVRKVVKFLVSTNIGEDMTILAALALLPGHPLLLTPVQILWVNLVTDGVLDITIAMEPKERDVMDEPPRRPDAQIINREILLNVLYVGLFMAVGTLFMFTRANAAQGILHAQTVAFTTMAMFQVFNALNCRSRTQSVFQLGLFSNRYLVGAIALSVMLQILANRLSFMQTALGTTTLAWQEWLTIAAVSSTVFIGDELRKLLQRRRRKARDKGKAPGRK